MAALRARRLEQPVLDAARSGRPFLGICIGMQMLFDASDESPGVAGLGIIPGVVREIPGSVKKPQVQWNVVHLSAPDDPLFADLGSQPWFYFVHSLHAIPSDPATVLATCDYGGAVTAAVRRGPVAAVQFHPEKSAGAGLALLGNFAAEVARSVGTVAVP
jgi:glutamine amidotransferase